MDPIESAYRRFCRERFALPDERHVADLERRIEVGFPEEYRRFLLGYNGGFFTEPQFVPPTNGCPVDRLRYLHGIGASHPIAELASDADLALFDDNTPPQILPIGYTLMGGLILLAMPPGEGTGAIMYKKAFGDFFCLTDNLSEFFGLLREPRDE